jgi:Flp pilus assembly protein TadB
MEMNWFQVLVIAFGNLAWTLPLFFWIRSEARSDARQQAQDTKELRRELIDVMRSISDEMKDFHGRLCSIEERRK